MPCRFHDFRDTHETKLIESGADIKAVSKRLGHRNIDITYLTFKTKKVIVSTTKIKEYKINAFKSWVFK